MRDKTNASLPVKGPSEREIGDRALNARMEKIRHKLLVLSGSPTAEAFERAIQPILESNSPGSDDSPAGRVTEEMAALV